MSNPFSTALDALVTQLRTVTTVLHYVEEFNGQALEDMKRIVRDRGASAFVRIVSVDAPAEGPLSAECGLLRVQIAVAAPGAVRTTSAAAAWEALWTAWAALRQGTSSIDFLMENWRLFRFQLENQEPDVTIVSAVIEAHADFGDVED